MYADHDQPDNKNKNGKGSKQLYHYYLEHLIIYNILMFILWPLIQLYSLCDDVLITYSGNE